MVFNSKTPFLSVFVGDLFVFIFSLWITLGIRNLDIPSQELFLSHLIPFSMLFVVWILVFFIAGLYENKTLIIRSRLPSRLFSAHFFNLVIASTFFYIVPYFGISPKIILFLYLLISTVMLFIWRIQIYSSFKAKSRQKNKAILIASGEDADVLKKSLDSVNSSFIITSHLRQEDLISTKEDVLVDYIITELSNRDVNTVIIDFSDENTKRIQSSLYSLIFKGIQFIDFNDLYEDLTGRVPLKHIDEAWFLKNASSESNIIYMSIKRLMDILLSLPLFIVSLLFYPFVWIAMKIEGPGALFYMPERVGQNGQMIKIYKFRTMTVMDSGNQLGQNQNKITKVGKILRVTRIDELPQLWNIIKGDLSLIGPRPEFPKLVDLYIKEIPHYNIRHLIKPGLSGWAQIHHEKPPHTVEETVEKLAFDLYYIKHRSIWIDFKIALQTIKTLLSRVGV